MMPYCLTDNPDILFTFLIEFQPLAVALSLCSRSAPVGDTPMGQVSSKLLLFSSQQGIAHDAPF
jgi:hypothetical protein